MVTVFLGEESLVEDVFVLIEVWSLPSSNDKRGYPWLIRSQMLCVGLDIASYIVVPFWVPMTVIIQC